MEFSIEINATKVKVWKTLWQDETFRDWASIIDPGTYMKGDMIQGNEIQFISSENGYGVTSLVDKLIPNEFVFFRHMADTKESGKEAREKDWTGGTESHTLMERDGVTTLRVEFDVPTELEEIFMERFPKALGRIKVLSERKK